MIRKNVILKFPAILKFCASTQGSRKSNVVAFALSFGQILMILWPDWAQIQLGTHLRWNCISFKF